MSSAPSEACSSLSALYGESGVAAATPVEVVDDAVLSGRARTTKQARVDGVDFHTSSVCPKLGRVPTTYKQSAGAESLLRPEVPATGRHFESLLFSTHIARTSSSKPSQNRVIASAMARSVFAKIVSLSTADLLPPRARQETLAPCS